MNYFLNLMFGVVNTIFIFATIPRASTLNVYPVTSPIGHTEEPHWDYRNGILYFVDIFGGQVFAYHYDLKSLKNITLNGTVSPVIPTRFSLKTLLVGLNRDIVVVEWDGKNKLHNQRRLITVSPQFPGSRFNDGKADAKGRLWWGTMGPVVNNTQIPNQGVFYTIHKHNWRNPVIAAAPVTISNGLAWNQRNNKLYYIDTPTRKIVEFDYNQKFGTISSLNRTAFDLNDWAVNITGVPDGMTIDTEDNLYVALYGGAAVIKVNPLTGKLLQIIPVPAKSVTSTMWGGPHLNTLFVTTSNRGMSDEEKRQYPDAGSVYAITGLGAKGLRANTANIKFPTNL